MAAQRTWSDSQEQARIAFWAEHLDKSHALMAQAAAHPVVECGEPLEDMVQAMAAAGVEVRFSQSLLAGQFPRMFLLRRGLIPHLIAVTREMNERGWILQIEDGYRTMEMQRSLGRVPSIFDRIITTCVRECRGQRPPRELVARRAMCMVANLPANGTHTCGCAVDISVWQREGGREIDRGRSYLEMSEYTPMLSPFVTNEVQENRRQITAVMEKHGFMHYPGEFWHYNQGDTMAQVLLGRTAPGRYGPVHWDPLKGQVRRYDDYLAPLVPLEELDGLIDGALIRLAKGA